MNSQFHMGTWRWPGSRHAFFLQLQYYFVIIVFSYFHLSASCHCNYRQQCNWIGPNIGKFAKNQSHSQSQSHYKTLDPLVCVSVTHGFVWIMNNLLVNVRALNPFFAGAFNVAVCLPIDWEWTTKANGRTILRTLQREKNSNKIHYNDTNDTNGLFIWIALEFIFTFLRFNIIFSLHWWWKQYTIHGYVHGENDNDWNGLSDRRCSKYNRLHFIFFYTLEQQQSVYFSGKHVGKESFHWNHFWYRLDNEVSMLLFEFNNRELVEMMRTTNVIVEDNKQISHE